MKNPWLDIPLADYEGHMALPEVGQASLLAETFERVLREYRPGSVAVIGCAGGNGFERIDPAVTRRVVGIDINADYLEQARARWEARLSGLELVEGDVQDARLRIAPVELIYVALLFEYVAADAALAWCRASLDGEGCLVTVIQLASPERDAVTPSPFAGVHLLAGIMRLLSPDELRDCAAVAGLTEVARRIAHACYPDCRHAPADSRPGRRTQTGP